MLLIWNSSCSATYPENGRSVSIWPQLWEPFQQLTAALIIEHKQLLFVICRLSRFIDPSLASVHREETWAEIDGGNGSAVVVGGIRCRTVIPSKKNPLSTAVSNISWLVASTTTCPLVRTLRAYFHIRTSRRFLHTFIFIFWLCAFGTA
jgi:hypothetical protein